MFRVELRLITAGMLAATLLGAAGCSTCGSRGVCDDACMTTGCESCATGDCDGGCRTKRLRRGIRRCDGCGHSRWFSHCGGLCGNCLHNRSLAIPDQYPVGAVMRSHFHQMQTNAEAMDFVLFQNDFVGQSAELTPDGKDKILEIAARMRSSPFPVIVERTWNNADPELDSHRRQLVAQILADTGNPDANTRVIVSPSYGPGKSSLEGQAEYYQFIMQGNFNNQNNNSFGNNGAAVGTGGGFF